MTLTLLYIGSLAGILLTFLLLGLTRASVEDADDQLVYSDLRIARSADLMVEPEPLLS